MAALATDRGNKETANMLVNTDILWECELIFHAFFFLTKSVCSLIKCLKVSNTVAFSAISILHSYIMV